MTPESHLQVGILDRTVNELVARFVDVLPQLLAGVVFLLVAGVLLKAILWALRRTLDRAEYGSTPVYRRFVVTIVSVFLWFAVALAFLSIVGLDGIAAALGTASGFVALGVAYALSGMIADLVAGVYLLRDPDFTPGDTVTVGDVTGEVTSIELRKTRLAVDGDTLVLANADIEKRWRKEGV